MEGINVSLLDYCGSDEAVANAARVSFGSFGDWNSIPEGYTKERSDKLIRYLAAHKHTSPFRQNSVTVRCEAPIFLARQLMKHQAGLTWGEISMRYCDKPVGFFYPEEWRSRPPKSLKQGSGEGVVEVLHRGDERYSWAETIKESYFDFIGTALELYEDMLRNNVAPEMARMVLPQSMLTQWVWTGNIMAFAHCYNLRSKDNAQVEARVFADALDKVIAPLFPVSWAALTGEQ